MGVIHRDVDLLVASSPGTALTAIAGDAVPDSLKARQLLRVDMNHVARCLPLVPLLRSLGLRVPQAAKAQSLYHAPHGGQGSAHSLGDPPEGAALLAEVQRMLQLLRIERPPLGAANAPSIRQRGVTT